MRNGKGTPSSEANESIGDKVPVFEIVKMRKVSPDARMIERASRAMLANPTAGLIHHRPTEV